MRVFVAMDVNLTNAFLSRLMDCQCHQGATKSSACYADAAIPYVPQKWALPTR